MVLAKGTGWLSHLDFLKSRFSPGDIEKVKAAVSPDDVQELFGKTVLPISKLNLASVIRFMVAADQVLGHGDLELFKESLRHKARKELSGIYKIFALILTPQALIQQTGRLWKQLYSQGEVAFEKVSDKSCTLKISDFPEMPRYHDVSIAAYGEEVIRLTGQKQVQSAILKSIYQGDDHCLIQFSWT